MRARTIWCTTLFLLCHPLLGAQTVTNELPRPPAGQADPQGSVQSQAPASPSAPAEPSQPQEAAPTFTLPPGLEDNSDPAFAPPPNPAPPAPPAVALPSQPADAEEQAGPPPLSSSDQATQTAQTANQTAQTADPGLATPLAPRPVGTPVHIEADNQEKNGDIYTLDGHVLLDYKQYIVQADHATYDAASSVVNARGHVTVDGGPEDEHILAAHGTMNLDAHTAHYYDAVGTLGVRALTHDRYTFTAPNPFALTGDEVLELGEGSYKVINGTMTSCRLPNPDWKLLAHAIFIENGEARARNSWFDVLNFPVLYLPYVSHPTKKDQRQSGFLIPIAGNSTTRGLIVGEELYLVLGRSADLIFGTQYYSKRGFAPYGQLRYKGVGEDFGLLRFHSLLDRLPGAENQGGVDIMGDARRDLGPHTRAIADVEFLNSYVYRQAFEANYTAAINSEVKSQAWLIHEQDGYAGSAGIERYQNFLSDTQGDEIKVLHTPELRLDAVEHPVGTTPFYWGGSASAAAMSRSEPGFQTSTVIPRVDLYPHIDLPLSAGGWTLRSEGGIRETYYGRSQNPGAAPDQLPAERDASLNRTAFTGELDLRPPAAERDFSAPWIRRWFGGDLRHAIEPELTYRYVTGINNFQQVLRFDQVDIFNDTNELEYGLTQRLFLRHLRKRPCKGDEKLGPSNTCGGGTVDWLTWRVAQKHYFDPYFGGALTTGERNVIESTLDFTGIAFLTGPRSVTPVISRLRLRSSSATDFEWDLDYDTKKGRVQDSSVSFNYRVGQTYLSVADYRLHTLNGQPGAAGAPAAGLSNFNQLRLAAIYGSPVKRGLSAGVNLGYDFSLDQVQYLGSQAGYNRDCCGLTVEVRRYSLGAVRDDTQYLFSFTLAGVGTAGSLNRLLRVF